jgi:hypothetical protein
LLGYNHKVWLEIVFKMFDISHALDSLLSFNHLASVASTSCSIGNSISMTLLGALQISSPKMKPITNEKVTYVINQNSLARRSM